MVTDKNYMVTTILLHLCGLVGSGTVSTGLGAVSTGLVATLTLTPA